ncbi:ankyrin repeat domain-containing protein [Streptomyces sp. YS415]|uniref:ankyrin repeat domain-containing protein n=1 Tax=Streptomyces sp. YS415 TaxID=2944806 RepID=UPI0020209CA4|nr:ankyrin repeat domain-containing protein [Streptomyces sp. YS415]MCL7430315.1 ankyrin repeat domain-containing protein [Streptomyces sp. YS415]
MTFSGDDWQSMSYDDWGDLEQVRHRLARGEDPNTLPDGEPPLVRAAAAGNPEVVAELVRLVDDVDARGEEWPFTPLLAAVFEKHAAAARVLAEAGADPWRKVLGSWSPGRLSLAGPAPDLFEVPGWEQGLTWLERTAAAEARRINVALASYRPDDGTALACVAGIDAAEAARRLRAESLTDTGPGSRLAAFLESDYDRPDEELELTVAVTDVPGGCVVIQQWGHLPADDAVLVPLTKGTFGYGYYLNPKGGEHGMVMRDGVFVRQEEVGDWCFSLELPDEDDDEGYEDHEALAQVDLDLFNHYVFDHSAAYACAMAGLRPADARAFTGAPDRWLRLTF